MKSLHSTEFYLAPAQQQVGNGERSNVVQTKKHVGSTTPTRTTPKSAKSPTNQPLDKSPIRPPKSIKDRLKNLSPIKPEQLKQNHNLSLAKLQKCRWIPKWTRKEQEAHSKCPQEQSRP